MEKFDLLQGTICAAVVVSEIQAVIVMSHTFQFVAGTIVCNRPQRGFFSIRPDHRPRAISLPDRPRS